MLLPKMMSDHFPARTAPAPYFTPTNTSSCMRHWYQSTITSPQAYNKNLNANLPEHTTGSLRRLQTTPTASASPSWLAPHYPASSQTPLHYLQAPIPPLAARFGSWNQVPETKTPISSRYQPMMKSVCTSAQILMCSFLCFKVPVSSTPNATLSN